MKCVLILFFAFTCPAPGQNGFTPAIPDEPVDFSRVGDSDAWVRGHWTALDSTDDKDKLSGPSTSEISCDHSSKTCTDTGATIAVTGTTFALTGGCDTYTIEQWNSKEIVASNISGACRVRNVIKFDRVQKRVYSLQTVSEPSDSLPKGLRDACKLTGMKLELKNSTLWRR